MGAVSAAVGIGSSVASGVKANEAKKEALKKEREIAKKEAKDESIFNKQYYQDMTKRTEVQNMLRILDENQKTAEKRSAAQSAVMGSTTEQQLAEKEGIRKTYADSVAEIASNASSMRDGYLSNYQNRNDANFEKRLGMHDQIAQINQQESANWGNAAQNAFSASASMLSSGLGTLSQAQSPTTPANTPAPTATPDLSTVEATAQATKQQFIKEPPMPWG